MKLFVPVSDDLLFAPDVCLDTLVPYRYGVDCHHALRSPPALPAANGTVSDESRPSPPA